jgi:hypothetical protein
MPTPRTNEQLDSLIDEYLRVRDPFTSVYRSQGALSDPVPINGAYHAGVVAQQPQMRSAPVDHPPKFAAFLPQPPLMSERGDSSTLFGEAKRAGAGLMSGIHSWGADAQSILGMIPGLEVMNQQALMNEDASKRWRNKATTDRHGFDPNSFGGDVADATAMVPQFLNVAAAPARAGKLWQLFTTLQNAGAQAALNYFPDKDPTEAAVGAGTNVAGEFLEGKLTPGGKGLAGNIFGAFLESLISKARSRED